MTEKTTGRLHFIDNLRASTMLAIVILHSSLAFTTPDFYLWPARDIYNNKLFNVFVLCLLAFLMPTFFFISGFVANRAHGHLGSWRFLWQRLKRIGIPFLVGMVLLFYFHSLEWFRYIVVQCHNGLVNNCLNFSDSAANFWRSLLQKMTSTDFRTFYDSTGALWFLYYLLLLSCLTVIVLILKQTVFDKIITSTMKIKFWQLVDSPGFIILPILCSMLFLWSLNEWRINLPLSFVPQPLFLLFYGLYFTFGWLVYHSQELMNKLIKAQNFYLLAVVVIFALIILTGYATLQEPQSVEGHRYSFWLRASTVLLYAVDAWAMVCFLVGFYMRHLKQPYAVLRYISDASYWIYLIQLPIIVYMQSYLAPMKIPVLVKLLLIFITVMIIALISYQLLVQRTFIGRILHGHRSSVAKRNVKT